MLHINAGESNFFSSYTGWSASKTSTTITFSSSSATAPTSASARTLTFDSIANGSTVNTNYYATVSTYVAQDCTGTAVDTGVVIFRYTEGVTMSATIDPTLTFTVTGVNSGGTVNSATTNVTTTPTSIPFASIVKADNNAIAAHQLSVTTNAATGFTVYVRYTDAMKSGNIAIKNHTGTNGTPTSFPAAGSVAPSGGDGGGALAYTTSDATLSGTADRFTSTPGNKWAALSTTNAEVMYSNVPAISQAVTEKIGYQMGIHSTTPAGLYSTTIIYTIAPSY